MTTTPLLPRVCFSCSVFLLGPFWQRGIFWYFWFFVPPPLPVLNNMATQHITPRSYMMNKFRCSGGQDILTPSSYRSGLGYPQLDGIVNAPRCPWIPVLLSVRRNIMKTNLTIVGTNHVRNRHLLADVAFLPSNTHTVRPYASATPSTRPESIVIWGIYLSTQENVLVTYFANLNPKRHETTCFDAGFSYTPFSPTQTEKLRENKKRW